MRSSVEETLGDGSIFRFSIEWGVPPITCESNNQIIAGEILEYKAVGAKDFVLVLPKAAQMDNEQRMVMRGTFRDQFVTLDNEDIFEIPTANLFRIRSEVWLRAETTYDLLMKKV